MAQKIKFHYIKSPNYTEIPAHGAYGGPSPTGDKIAVSFYSERLPIPTAMTHGLHEDGTLNEKDVGEIEGKEGVVRIVHSTIYLDLDAAISFQSWLAEKIELLKKGKK